MLNACSSLNVCFLVPILVMVPQAPRALTSVLGQAIYSSSSPLYPLLAQMCNLEPEGAVDIMKSNNIAILL